MVLRATRHYIENGFNCTVQISTRKDRSLLYSIPFLDIPMTCLSALEIWDQRVDTKRFCRNLDDPRGKEAYWIMSPTMYVHLYTSRHDWNYERKGFELVITSFRQPLHFDTCYGDEFQCSNKLCIWKELACNHENNCGDLSDEDCVSKTLSTIIIVSAAITVVVLIFCLISYIRKRRGVGPHDLSRTTSAQSFQSDGSAMSGFVDTTYRPLYTKPLPDSPLVLVGDLPSRTPSEDGTQRPVEQKRTQPMEQLNRSISEP
ncbi:uncharacterized protein LOC135400039 isoform X2 [Ornithodoros turicata]